MSTVKVNTVDKRTGGTLTLGGCGTTVTLGAGATQSGFGRTGTVDWCTTAKTAPFTGVSGTGYFVNTTCGAVTVTLPASPSAGDIISIADYASTFQTNNLTICRNSSKINGACTNATLNTIGQSITLVYVDATRGWKNTMDSTSNVTGQPNFIVATGGTITCCGDYKIHTFTADATFTICSAPTPANNNVDYLVVAGGGGGGGQGGGGGGAGGFRESKCAGVSGCWTASPLASATSLPISVQAYPITVGGGGSAGLRPSPSPACITAGGDGSNSVFSTITSTGGGGGGTGFYASPVRVLGNPGGSGGGSSDNNTPNNIQPGGSGNTPPTSPPQGNNGGQGQLVDADWRGAGGGGGATAVGVNAANSPVPSGKSGPGGAGATTSISGSPTAYAGGGGGGYHSTACSEGSGGTGGGGNGTNPSTQAQSGTANTGGGAGGGGGCLVAPAGAGGSGIVIIRYKYQ
jgi:hypothetical protein